MVNSDVGWYHYYARRYDDAIRHSRRTLELTPGFYWARRCILLSFAKKNDLRAAVAEARQEMEEAGASKAQSRDLGELPPSEAMRIYWLWDLDRKLPGRPRRSQTDLAIAYLGLGKRELALAALEGAFEERYGWQLPFLGVEPMMDPLRDEPRFKDLVHQIRIRSSLTAGR
jgi:tetratricopeptide (TPR) repeat protein